jgi:hypothetical protein
MTAYLYTNDFEGQNVEVDLKPYQWDDGTDDVILSINDYGAGDYAEVVLGRDQALVLGKALIERFEK